MHIIYVCVVSICHALPGLWPCAGHRQPLIGPQGFLAAAFAVTDFQWCSRGPEKHMIFVGRKSRYIRYTNSIHVFVYFCICIYTDTFCGFYFKAIFSGYTFSGSVYMYCIQMDCRHIPRLCFCRLDGFITPFNFFATECLNCIHPHEECLTRSLGWTDNFTGTLHNKSENTMCEMSLHTNSMTFLLVWFTPHFSSNQSHVYWLIGWWHPPSILSGCGSTNFCGYWYTTKIVRLISQLMRVKSPGHTLLSWTLREGVGERERDTLSHAKPLLTTLS